MADFPSSPKPSYPVEETSPVPEVLVTRYRDGGEQRRFKGTGAKRVFKLKFGDSLPVTNTERLTITNHYDGQSGTLYSFSWTHPDRGETLTVRYAGPPQFTNVGYGYYSGSIDLQEVPA